MAQAVIMAGGQGERFWPLTHKDFPKYRIRLNDKESLLQRTYGRLLRLYDRKNIHVVTTQDHAHIIREELPKLPSSNILIEPSRRNTAAAIFFSCKILEKSCGNQEVVSFFPADHLIQNEAKFRQTLKNAIRAAQKKSCLVTIGVKPTFACTGYGYIQAGKPIQSVTAACRVKAFKEKPSRKIAEKYLKMKDFFWNGGIFTWRIQTFLETLNLVSPDFYRALDFRNLKGSYDKLPRLSIDLALLEKADNLTLVKTNMDWCDMGSWDMFLEKARRDAQGKFVAGNSPQRDCRNVLLLNYKENAPLIAFGVSDLIAVQTDQGTLICKRHRSEEAAVLLKK